MKILKDKWSFDGGASEIVRSFGSILTADSRYFHDVKRVSEHSAESRGFSPGPPVSSHKECGQGGLGLASN